MKYISEIIKKPTIAQLEAMMEEPHCVIKLLPNGDVEKTTCNMEPSEIVYRPPKPRVVCLCGSTRFMQAYEKAGIDFALKGYIVLTVQICKHGGFPLEQDVADRIDELHLRKIDLADEVFILNVGGYIGDSTRREIAYAKANGKPITYLEPKGEGKG